MDIATIILGVVCILLIILLLFKGQRDKGERDKGQGTRDKEEREREQREQEERQRQMTEMEVRVKGIVGPMQRQMEEFRRAVNDSYVKDNATRQSLSDQIDRLLKMNQTLGEEARNLTEALRGDSKTQGDWGETILENLLEQAGLKKDVDFTVQLTRDTAGNVLRSEEGAMRRPDFVVHLPGGRHIVIDSKMTLTAYVDYVRAGSAEERAQAQKKVVLSVKKHIDELKEKQYQKVVKNSAEQVLMFIPNEGAYMLAHAAAPDLWDYAYRHKVVIVSSTHLFSVMQLVSQLWRVEKQNRNADEIARLGGLIYDKIAAFTKEFENVHRAIAQAEAAYAQSLRTLTSGPQSVISRSKRMKELGAKTSKEMSGSVAEAWSLEEPTE